MDFFMLDFVDFFDNDILLNNEEVIIQQIYFMESQQLFAKIKSIFPPLEEEAKKGQNGQIGVIGGSYEFSGPPYYSAMASLRVGTDIAHIFCPKTSATAIKSYSPDLAVHPVFDLEQDIQIPQDKFEETFEEWLKVIKRWYKDIYAWVVGPGLGHDKYINAFFPKLVKNLPQNSVVVFDADGIHYLCNNPELFMELKRYRTVITPNFVELARVQKCLGIQISQVKQRFENQESEIVEFDFDSRLPFTLFIKGPKDIILGPRNFVISVQGGPKRSANIGDILAGSVAICSEWNFEYGPALASIIVRMATKRGFEKQGRSLTAHCIINEIVPTIKILETQPPYL